MKIENRSDMEKAAETIWEKHGCALLLKGGHSINDANDLLYDNGSGKWIKGERVDNPNTHGTGCTLSSAIAANLAKGFCLFDAVVRAKEYITDALRANLNLGHGSGPLNHAFCLAGKYTEVQK